MPLDEYDSYHHVSFTKTVDYYIEQTTIDEVVEMLDQPYLRVEIEHGITKGLDALKVIDSRMITGLSIRIFGSNDEVYLIQIWRGSRGVR